MAFAGQAAWITGASSGIGAALARGLARQGARLILSGRNVDALEQVSEQCGGGHLILPFETTDHDAIAPAVAAAEEWSGRIDVLINNAGISQRSLAVDTDLSVYERIIAVDLLAPIALTQAVLPAMVKRGSGRIAMISSIAGKVGVPMRTAYCAAKFGLAGYADALRAEVGYLGVQVHNIYPGSIRTDVSRNALTADGSRRGVSDQVIDNGIDPDEAATRMIAAMAAGEREIIVAEGSELAMGEERRMSDSLLDLLGGFMAKGYAKRMNEGAQ
ncbi:short-subunit dehydrogenase [Novosphingobium kunmingense]|uniref:Short-subunit dehydrogenase n=1 Tax=Novosphingobium kunmingense TaxID=1211806 RepID=A0A2N0I3S0_9SPHN|nr:SDR family NAD(P)-dependent oxidoreductase [Novosphingobium kunmingense]PKB25815.1 short-subunit dehydrogenase [Novosphingobium kunmingense]